MIVMCVLAAGSVGAILGLFAAAMMCAGRVADLERELERARRGDA